MITSFSPEAKNEEDCREHWNESMSRSQLKHPNQQASSLPTKLPSGAHLPSVAGTHNYVKIVVWFFVCVLCFLMEYSLTEN